ncbi:hypothetical protein AcW1_002647 [Taiwanofungus camphoratus]|nr:hypothetical protein AcW1_002647 [Antrodia cinnamomea]
MGLDPAQSPLLESSVQERNALPQYGFGPDVEFESLVDSNPFLFRVHTPPKETSPFYDRTEPYFVGPLFGEAFSSATLCSRDPSSPSPFRSPPKSTYADVARHLDWTTRASSPYVSASFSFAWAIWEATRRYHHSMKHSIEIAIIDAKAVSGRAVTAAELLRQGASKDRHQDHWKWYRFALESQDVLVWGYVPGTAVLASVPLMQVLSKLPSYFLCPDPSALKDTPMGRLGWDYLKKKPSYRQFCQDTSDRFLRMNVDRRLRDTTAGSARLALSLLRPWFHKLAADDFVSATVAVSELALVIARWPGLWWVREHPEVRELIRCIVHIVGEEVREARRTQAAADAGRMQDIVGGLEQLVQTRQQAFRYLPSAPPTPAETDVAEETPVLPKSPTPSVLSVRPAAESAPAPAPEPLSAPASEPEMELEATPEPASEPEPEPELEPEPKSQAAEESRFEPESDSAKPSTSTAMDPVLPPDLNPHPESAMESSLRTTFCMLSGIFFGAFVTMCALAPDNRELANFLT